MSQVSGAAPLASPALTGTPTAPTAAAGDSSTQIATDAFVTNAVNNAIAGVILTGTGNPNTNVSGGPTAGTLNQMYQNLTATGNNDWLWRCSTGGTGGAGGTAVWVGKL